MGDFGLELAGMEIVGQVEIDDYCQKILKLRWPDVPKWTDISEFSWKVAIQQVGEVDLISGGFPCQDISSVNTSGKGLDGDSSGLWWQMFRLIREVRPSYCLIENVRGLIQRGMGDVLGALAGAGYDCEWSLLRASDFGAPHQRERIFIVAYSQSKSRFKAGKSVMSNRERIKARSCDSLMDWRQMASLDWKMAETYFDGKIDGTPDRLERTRLLGNGQVVQVVEWIGKRILEYEQTVPTAQTT